MVTTATAAPTATKVPNQAGILEGLNPTQYRPSNPLPVFIIQVSIILAACRLLHWPLSKIRQPRVIAEVVGGIVLGPTVMGRIPGFTNTIFSKDSRPLLSLVANLGLVFFLFLVGLEVDLRLLVANYKVALSVGTLGMILPFGLGIAIAYGLYNEFGSDHGTQHVSFGVFVLFIGVAMAITAFPVLARILTELKLLRTNVGTIVLSAGVGNDVVGWILLALTVAIVNAGNRLTALYVLLIAVGWILFLIYAVRPVFIWILRRTGSLENGPTQATVALTLFLVMASAFFTDAIGIHAIFGGFLIGLICPHEGGFTVRLTEKVEDFVSVLFLPLYFALSGLNTDIGLLNGGMVWAYLIGVIAVAFFAKIGGGTIAARLNGLVWRESLTIGVLMSCKGLVELIVLNIGLQAGIISRRVFTMFVVMALVTTFATTPLTAYLYPPWYQKKLEQWKRGEIDWDGNLLKPENGSSGSDGIKAEKAAAAFRINRITILLRLDSLASLFTFINLLGGEYVPPAPKVHKFKRRIGGITEEEGSRPNTPQEAPSKRPLEVHGVRILELTQRTSSVMKVAEVEEFLDRDPVLNVFKTFGWLNHLAVSAGLSWAPEDSFAEVLIEKAQDRSSELLLVPWSESGIVSDPNDLQNVNLENRFTSSTHNSFISEVLESAACSTAILVNRGFGGIEKTLTRTLSIRSIRPRHATPADPTLPPIQDPSHHLFFPFFGGPDDRLALHFILQLAHNPNVTATIVHVVYNKDAKDKVPDLPQVPTPAHRQDLPRGLSLSNVPTLATLETATSAQVDDITADDAFFETLADSLPANISDRVSFERFETSQPLQYIIATAKKELGCSKNAGDLLVMGRSANRLKPYIRSELVQILASLSNPSGAGNELRRCLGDVAEAAIVANIKASILVLQAGGKVLENDQRMDGGVNAGSSKMKV